MGIIFFFIILLISYEIHAFQVGLVIGVIWLHGLHTVKYRQLQSQIADLQAALRQVLHHRPPETQLQQNNHAVSAMPFAEHEQAAAELPLAANAPAQASFAATNIAQTPQSSRRLNQETLPDWMSEQPAADVQAASNKQNSSRSAAGSVQTYQTEDDILQRFWAWFGRGNPVLKAGIVILFLGLGFLLRYASAHVQLPLEWRYVFVGALGAAACVGGWYLSRLRPYYGLALQGFGVAVMYLSVLSALKLHALLSPAIAFVLMLLCVGLMVALALWQSALPLAQMAVLGGMAAPILTSTGSGNYVILFTYLALLNTGIAVLAWHKAWRSLNIIGFAASLSIAYLWGGRDYQAALLPSVLPFLLYHWLLYSLIVCLFARHEVADSDIEPLPDDAPLAEMLSHFAQYGLRIHRFDYALFFATACSGFALLASIWRPAPAALSAAIFYALFFVVLRWKAALEMMQQAAALLILLFISLAIPLHFNQDWTAALWTLQAALIYAFASHLQQPHLRLFALLIYGLAALAQLGTYQPSLYYLLTGEWLSTAFIACGGAAIYLIAHLEKERPRAVWEQNSLDIALLSAAVFLALLIAITMHDSALALLAYATLSLAWSAAQYRQAHWVKTFAAASYALLVPLIHSVPMPSAWQNPSLLYTMLALLLWLSAYYLHYPAWRDKQQTLWLRDVAIIVMAVEAIAYQISAAVQALYLLEEIYIVFAPSGLILLIAWAWWRQWQLGLVLLLLSSILLNSNLFAAFYADTRAISLLALICNFACHVWIVQRLQLLPVLREWAHQGSWLCFCLLATFIMVKFAYQHLSPLAAQFAALLPPLILWHISQSTAYQRYAQDFRQPRLCAAISAAYLIVWMVHVNSYPPLQSDYLPLLNMIEMSSLYLLWQGKRWCDRNVALSQAHNLSLAALAGLSWLVLSSGVARIWHFFFDIDWQLRSLMQSFSLQACLSVIWTIVAISLMFIGNRRSQRLIWLAGAGLIVLVIGKLFLLELANSGGIERIVSFIVVGLLLLWVGWFAPVPPKTAAED